ncbi:phage integrase [Marinobacterium rhizophilum]|uniref:phage integrase n=1 Tax=Marinobacterium rhizophilum TaxID=420402 RepID=UPI00037AE881|nr:hypothetical protein [Marinobacterium rhizophilum]
MAITKTDSGWKFDIHIGHSCPRYRKTFKTKAEGKRWEAWLRAQHAQGPDWEPKKADRRRLSQLIDEWFKLHGSHLKDGERRRDVLNRVCEALGNPVGSEHTGIR